MRDVAVVAFAQSELVRRQSDLTEPGMIMPVVNDVYEQCGLKRSERDMAEVASRSRRAAMSNRYAQVKKDVSADDLLQEPYWVDPLRKHDCPPITDGCAAVILVAGDRAKDSCERPGWIRGIEHRID